MSDSDRRALAVGAVVLIAVGVVYPFVADSVGRPLSAFVLPCLATAVVGGWRPTVVISMASLAIAVVIGIAGPLDASALSARWVIIAIGALLGSVGAAVREGQAARLSELRATITTREAFERALVPTPVPPPGIAAVARYRPAEARLELGGDFLEAVTLGDGRLAVLIGDVCGHGPREAAFGAALRAGWKGIALNDEPDPVHWIDALDLAFFRDGRIDVFATVCTGYLDLHSRSATLVCAGHPRPIEIGSRARALDLPAGPPLGIGVSDTWAATELAWDGAALLFYTDGLIENPSLRRETPRRWGVEGLLGWVDTHPSAPTIDAWADSLMAAATAERDVLDDIATLIVAADGVAFDHGQASRKPAAATG